MKLVAIVRVKNAKDTIKDCLSRLSDLCDEIIIVDNGSTDGTKKIYKKFHKIITINHTKGFNEGRDKNLLLKLAKKRNPDWILWIDQDEIFEEIASRKILDKYMNNPKVNLVQFRLFHFWLSKTKYRVDGIWKTYTAFPQRFMWRNLKSAYFRNWRFHSGGIMGVPQPHLTSFIRLKHYGYTNKRQVAKKYKFYTDLKDDPMSKKTILLDPNDKKVRLKKWQPGLLNSYKDGVKWGLIDKFIKIKNLLLSYNIV